MSENCIYDASHSRKRTSQSSAETNGRYSNSAIAEKIIDRESQSEASQPKHLFVRLCFPLVFALRTLGPSVCDILWQCYVQYVQLYPLSPSARMLRATPFRWSMFVIGENFFMVLCVAYNAFLVWSMLEPNLPSLVRNIKAGFGSSMAKWLARLLAYTAYTMSAILLIVFITLPFWWRGGAWGTWRRAAWQEEVCVGW